MSNEAAKGSAPRVSKPEYSHMNNGNNNDLENALHRGRATGAVSLPPDLFEKLYLSPKTEVKGELRATFGNPTPMYARYLPMGSESPKVPGRLLWPRHV